MSWGWGQPTFWGHHAIVTDGHGGLPGAVSLGPLYALSLAPRRRRFRQDQMPSVS